MADTLITINDVLILLCSPEGTKIDRESDAVELIGEALSAKAQWVVIPVERLTADFFKLKTGLAGQIMQKFVTYKRNLVVMGDFFSYAAESHALHDFIYETNRGNQVWFLANLEELTKRLNQK